MALLSHIHVIPKAKAIVSRCDIIPGQSWREASAKAGQEIGVTVLPLCTPVSVTAPTVAMVP